MKNYRDWGLPLGRRFRALKLWFLIREQGVEGLQARLRRELDRVIEYRLMSGKAGASPLWQLVAHLVNHATYHRGQVTTMLRQLGVPAPKSTDMITFFRE